MTLSFNNAVHLSSALLKAIKAKSRLGQKWELYYNLSLPIISRWCEDTHMLLVEKVDFDCYVTRAIELTDNRFRLDIK